MKVSELSPGSIYVPDRRTVTKDYNHIILGSRPPTSPVFKIKERCLWRGFRDISTSDSKEIYMYLGFTMDAWDINGIYKHHWFLVNGEKIMVNNYSLKLLREIEYGSKL